MKKTEELKKRSKELSEILSNKKTLIKVKNGITFYEMDKTTKEWEELQNIIKILKYDIKEIAFSNMK